MNFGEIIKTKRWKVFMGYVYGWGAAIVMIGALFKLEHLPYSGYILAVGLLTEAFIFFLSAFEPPIELPDWSKVYPELREDYDILDFEESKQQKDFSGKLGELLNKSDITPELINSVSKGLNDLSNTAKGISDISSATLATDLYVKNLGSASDAMNKLAEVNYKAHDSIHTSVEAMAQTYTKTAQQLSTSGTDFITKLNKTGEEFTAKVSQSGELLAKTYQETSRTLAADLQNLGQNSKSYSTGLESLNKNIDALNNSFVTQLKGMDGQFKSTQKFNADIQAMNDVLASSISEIKKYKENAEQLNKNLEALNSIYGGMLGAMNYKK
jgi:gliding motility-associated protein GldL